MNVPAILPRRRLVESDNVIRLQRAFSSASVHIIGGTVNWVCERETAVHESLLRKPFEAVAFHIWIPDVPIELRITLTSDQII